MAKMKVKKILALAGIAIMISISAVVISNPQYVKVALADDDEEEEDDDDDSVKVIDTSPENNTKQETEYITVYRKLSDTVTTKTDTIIRHDSDGDGLYDDEDAHPTINEYFIVKDDNLNGIDDRYEPQS
ncbi:MAG: hypothetical protein A2Z52_02135 [Candidatus Moranbacteria bacterium RBG_19FT_COMBO_42_6]|nr:MAG: hypothetical protein A2Z52_02135 [Candidatus Moranbacteria bacterium RBG_19FT_COMBO_42_6]